MGNEMGNNNTSGLQAEDNKAPEGQGKSSQEPVLANDVKAENHFVPVAESKDYNENETGLPSDDPNGQGDTCPHDQTSDEREQEETIIHPPAESPKTAMESNEADNKGSNIKPASLSRELEDQEKLTESNLEENLLGRSHNRIEKQAAFKKEGQPMLNPTFVSLSSSLDPEPQDSESKFDQHEFTKTDADQSVQGSTNSQRGIQDILGSKVVCTDNENGYLLDSSISDNVDGAVVLETNQEVERKEDDLLVKESARQEDKIPGEEKSEAFEVGNEFRNDLSKTTKVLSDFSCDIGEKSDADLTSEMNCYGNNSLESEREANLMPNSLNFPVDVPLPGDKCMVLTEKTELIRKESESEETNETVKESEIEKDNASQTDSFIEPDPGCENNEDEGSACTANDPASNGDCPVEEAKFAEHGYGIDLGNDNQNEASVADCKEPNGENMKVLDLGICTEELLIANSKTNEEEPRDCKQEEQPVDKQIVEEIKEQTETLCVTGMDKEERNIGEQFLLQSFPAQEEASLQPTSVSVFHSQNYQQNKPMGSEDAPDNNESTQESTPENYSLFLVTASSKFHATGFIAENLVSAVELTIEKPQQEVLHSVISAPETATETITSASASQSSEQCETTETSVFARGCYEAQARVGRLTTDSHPDDLNIRAQMLKSPSFDLDLRIEAKNEESDQTPLLYQDKTEIESLPHQADVSLQEPLMHVQYCQQSLQHQAVRVEEKVITLERSDSEKSRTPFLGFLKDDKEAHAAVTPAKQDKHSAAKKATKELWDSPTKDLTSTSPKGKEKLKRRSSLFGNCICCATVIN